MKRGIFVICDREEAYIAHLTEYLSSKKTLPFEIQGFTDSDCMEQYAQKAHIQLLLISAEMMNEEIRRQEIDQIVLLSEGEEEESWELPYVNKYQSSDDLLAETMNYAVKNKDIVCPMSVKTDIPIYAVYSPVARCGKTSFSLVFGEILARQKPVLYINLEDYHGFDELTDTDYSMDLSDLIYLYRQNDGNFLFRFAEMVRSFGKLDYIPPALSGSDLKGVAPEDWLQIFSSAASGGSYECLILDMGNQLDNLNAVLSFCRRIFIPVLEDPVSRAKLCQFEKNLKMAGMEQIFDRIRLLHLPKTEGTFGNRKQIEHLMTSEFGQYIKSMIEAEFGSERGLERG